MMTAKIERPGGIAILAGSLLMFVTMVLHPAGGNLEHLQQVSLIIIVSHSIAIASIPFLLFGYWALRTRLETEEVLATFAFLTTSFGLFAVMCAAALNGLALPFLVNHYEAGTEAAEMLMPVLRYNMALNHAFDLIYIWASCGATIVWSIAILKSKKLPLWTGYLGIALSTVSLVMLVAGFEFLNLDGFRLFVFGFVSWKVSIGVVLVRTIRS